MSNRRTNNMTENQKYTMLVALIVALVMMISFVVALTKFADVNSNESSQSESSDAKLSSAPVSEESSVPEAVVSEPEPEYEYYDKLTFTNTDISNSDVVNGTLAVIKNDSVAFPSVNSSNLANIYTSKSDVYELSGSNLYLYNEAFSQFDSFIVKFYESVPDNGLIIDKAYLAASEANPSDGSVDLSTGYSLKFSIYGSSYGFGDDEFRYLTEQAYRYGIIQRYPKDKKTHTGFEENSTIYRYVGMAHSYYMNYYKTSLEEYIDTLRTQKVIEFKSGLEDNTAYVIYYVPLDDSGNTTSVPVPSDEGYPYTISGDGSKGYIVTVKLAVN